MKVRKYVAQAQPVTGGGIGMRLSIIVPVYNMAGGGKLNQCLESLMSQEIEEYEVIAVDDCSRDGSPEILKEFAARFGDRLKVILSPENRRQGGARNLGLEAACGEWVGFVDSDDWVARDMYARLLARAEETGADIVGCDLLVTEETGRETGSPVRENVQEQTGVLGTAERRKIVLAPGSMVVKIYKRTLFTENHIRFPEKMFYEDNAIAALPFLYAKRFERVEESLYFYYQHSASTVHGISVDKCRDRMRAMELFAEECRNRGFLEEVQEEADYVLYELGYCNTLFSYLQAEKHPDRKFLRELRDYLLSHVPDIGANIYYGERTDEETRKLTELHLKSPAWFLIYYRVLHLYRGIVGGLRGRHMEKAE